MKGHDRAITRLRAAAKKITLREASDAFVASLSTRNLEWRAVLPALVMARHLPDHRYQRQTRWSDGAGCAVCGFCAHEEEFGDSPGRLARWIEALGDERPRPTAEDVDQLNAILAAVAEQQRLAVDGRVRRAELAKALKVVKGDKYERMDLLDALGRCGVLAPAGAGFLRRYVRFDERDEGSGNNEFAYPFALWEARLGFDAEAVRELFPQPGVDAAARPPAAAELDEPRARAELEARSAAARGGDAIAEVLFAPGGLWIARLDDGRHALFHKLGRRWRWSTGPRDDVLAMVPEALFADAVAAVLASERGRRRV